MFNGTITETHEDHLVFKDRFNERLYVEYADIIAIGERVDFPPQRTKVKHV